MKTGCKNTKKNCHKQCEKYKGNVYIGLTGVPPVSGKVIRLHPTSLPRLYILHSRTKS